MKVKYSPDLVSGMEFTYEHLIILVNALQHAREHCDLCLSDDIEDSSVRGAIKTDLENFTSLQHDLMEYLDKSGLTFSEKVFD